MNIALNTVVSKLKMEESIRNIAGEEADRLLGMPTLTLARENMELVFIQLLGFSYEHFLLSNRIERLEEGPPRRMLEEEAKFILTRLRELREMYYVIKQILKQYTEA